MSQWVICAILSGGALHHSTASLARARNDGDAPRPSALAVLSRWALLQCHKIAAKAHRGRHTSKRDGMVGVLAAGDDTGAWNQANRTQAPEPGETRTC
jgi:hypothetical protein